jgi:adenylyltransferase/sulfurtransferase
VPSCAEGGVLGVLCASIASVMGTEAVKLITGIGESLLGRLLIYDALAMSHRTIAIRKDPQAPPITALADYDVLCGTAADDAADAGAGLSASELKDLLDSGAPVALIDVREPGEWEINRIDGARLIPKSVLESAGGPALLPAGSIPVLYCKSGARSAQAVAALTAAGVTGTRHLRGGITAWAQQFDPDMATY